MLGQLVKMDYVHGFDRLVPEFSDGRHSANDLKHATIVFPGPLKLDLYRGNDSSALQVSIGVD